jgi:hypothetical protein
MALLANSQESPLNRGGFSVSHQYDRPTPAWVTSHLVKFGYNPYGQPLFRVVWSEGRLEQVLLSSGEYGWQQRYPGAQRWMLEKWLPTSYSRVEWNTLFAAGAGDSDSSLWGKCYLGPYLEHGDYHCSYKLEYRGEYMPLTVAVIEYYARLIEHGKEYTVAQNKFAVEQRLAREKRAWNTRFDAIFDDAQPAFGVTRLMSGYGGKTADRVKPEDISFASTASLPSWVPTTPGFRQV